MRVELLVSAGPKTIKEITKIIQDIWQTEHNSEDLKNALAYPLRKTEIEQI